LLKNIIIIFIQLQLGWNPVAEEPGGRVLSFNFKEKININHKRCED